MILMFTPHQHDHSPTTTDVPRDHQTPSTQAQAASTAPTLGPEGWAATPTEGDGDGDDDSIIALVESDFQSALLQSYETFAQTIR